LPESCSHLGAPSYPRYVESMEKVLQCECGFEARAEHEEGLVAEVRRHAWEAHRMPLSPDQALLLAFRAELDAKAPAPGPAGSAAHDPSHDVMSNGEEKK
jgi:hypothetical protein